MFRIDIFRTFAADKGKKVKSKNPPRGDSAAGFTIQLTSGLSVFSIDKRFAIVTNIESLLGWLALQAATVEGVPCVGLAVE